MIFEHFKSVHIIENPIMVYGRIQVIKRMKSIQIILVLAPSLNVNELVRGFVRQLLQALLALHEHCIVHCDVKGDNIFIANDKGQYIVKLGVSLFGKMIEKIAYFFCY